MLTRRSAPANAAADPDLKEYQRRNALSALSRRNTDKGLEPIDRRPINRNRKENPLFEMNDSDLSEDERLQLAEAEAEDQDEDDVGAEGADHVDQAEESHPNLEEACGVKWSASLRYF